MSDECKPLEKEAKGNEKKNPTEAVELYKQAAQCYIKNAKPKDGRNCLVKAAKILRDRAKTTGNPDTALDVYKQSIDIYNQADKGDEAQKVLAEAHHKYIESAKALRAEAKKIEDEISAEAKLAQASEYAKEGQDSELANDCWADSGEQFRKKAAAIDEPREALKPYKHAIQNFKKGENAELVNKIYAEAAESFIHKGTEIEKTKKVLILAIDNYVQAATLYNAAKAEDKAESLNTKVKDMCEFIGLPLDYITNYLDRMGTKAISLGMEEASAQ